MHPSPLLPEHQLFPGPLQKSVDQMERREEGEESPGPDVGGEQEENEGKGCMWVINQTFCLWSLCPWAVVALVLPGWPISC